MTRKTPITLARGVGVSPEISDVSLRIIEAGGRELEIETIDLGGRLVRVGQKPEKLKAVVSYPGAALAENGNGRSRL